MNPFFKILYPSINNKKCIDIGAVQHDITRVKTRGETWVHGFIAKHARSCVGLDIEKEQIDLVNKEFKTDIRFGNAETFDFDDKYEVVFAGDIIEHVSNQGLFIERAVHHLDKDGMFIITTPNSFGIHRVVRDCYFGLNSDPICNKQHTLWHSPRTLKTILSRYDLEIVDIKFYSYNKIIHHIFRALGAEKLLPHIFLATKKITAPARAREA